jgi:hypothetical protein
MRENPLESTTAVHEIVPLPRVGIAMIANRRVRP